jgi:hypothetical protein
VSSRGACDSQPGIGHLVLETDSTLAVQAITSGAYSESSIGSLAEEISSYVDLNFISFKCVFKGRDCKKLHI